LPAGIAASLAISGIALSVTNPFWLAWWATIGTAYIVEALDQGALGVGTFYTAHFITDVGWLSLIAFLLAGGRRLMSRAAYRAILGGCGIFLVALGGWFLSTGFGYVV
jgi:threonine/homoserine/homoserine lactone efflux protein